MKMFIMSLDNVELKAKPWIIKRGSQQDENGKKTANKNDEEERRSYSKHESCPLHRMITLVHMFLLYRVISLRQKKIEK